MKNYIIGIALALALVMGVAAFAETAEPATDSIPAVTEEAPNEGEAPAAETTAIMAATTAIRPIPCGFDTTFGLLNHHW